MNEEGSVDISLSREIMTPEDVALFLKKSLSWVYKHWQELGGVKLGGSLMFPSKEDLYCNLYVDPKTGKQIVDQFQYRKTIIKTLCKKADVENFTYHALRHSGASIMDNNSVPIGAIQKILGHENRTTTEIYLHSIGRTEQEAISVFERATQNSHTDSHTAEKTMGHPHTVHLN